ncbi:MAG: metal-dependent transcriptional regulator [Chloroflexaceae bacterium]|nr:metal-dependent transcriptional regulator [Chloroflexaceae bacterium]
MATPEKVRKRVTPAVEDYLKAIYILQQHTNEVTTSMLSEQMGGFKPGSVTGMMKRLADLKLVRYTPYQGVRLTDDGEKIALEVIRHHRLIELFLVKTLGYSWDEVHEEAETLEHHISEKLEARIAEYLGQPQFDPHGDPIPTLEGKLPPHTSKALSDLSVGQSGRITRVNDQNAEHLRYIADLGIVPGTSIQVEETAPFEGPVSIRVGHKVHALDRRLARTIQVECEPVV